MLSQLLEVKRRRERSVQGALARVAEEDRALQARQLALHEQRDALYRQWRARAAESGCFTHQALASLRAALSRLEGEDLALARERQSLADSREELAHERDELDVALRRTLREQEKLMLLAAELAHED